MLALIFGVLFAVSFLGFAITSRTKYSAASHLFWGVAFIIFTVCFTCAFCYTIEMDSKRSSHYIERQVIFDGFLNYGYCFLFGGWFIRYLRSIKR